MMKRIGLSILAFGFTTAYAAPGKLACPDDGGSHPTDLYYFRDSLETNKIKPADDAKDVADIIEVRKEFFAKGNTCDEARSFECPLTMDKFFGDLVCPEMQKAVADLIAHVDDDLAIEVHKLKKTKARPRPFEEHQDEILKDMHPECQNLYEEKKKSSFPSFHAAMSRAQALVLAKIFPERGPEFLARSNEIAISRNVLAVHFPSDVKAGQQLADKLIQALSTESCPENAHCFNQDLAAVKAQIASGDSKKGRTLAQRCAVGHSTRTYVPLTGDAAAQ